MRGLPLVPVVAGCATTPATSRVWGRSTPFIVAPWASPQSSQLASVTPGTAFGSSVATCSCSAVMEQQFEPVVVKPDTYLPILNRRLAPTTAAYLAFVAPYVRSRGV